MAVLFLFYLAIYERIQYSDVEESQNIQENKQKGYSVKTIKAILAKFRVRIGLRTLKTALAVTIAILLVEQYGTSAAGLLFAVMGAFSAMEPTVNASLRGCAAQIGSVFVGVCLALVMRALGIPGVLAAGFGIILVMVFYQLFRLHSSPVLPCLILVTICTDPALGAVAYGLERIWNTLLGQAAGMLINMLIFPYDNSSKIKEAMMGLDKDLIVFLEDMFNGDGHFPDTDEINQKMGILEAQLTVFADQRLLRRRRQRRLLMQLYSCEDTAQALLLEVETLHRIHGPGRLNLENYTALCALGAKLPEQPANNRFSVEDLVINYHVKRALELRQELKEELTSKEIKNG